MRYKVSIYKAFSVVLLLLLFLIVECLQYSKYIIALSIPETCIIVMLAYAVMVVAVISTTKQLTGYIIFLILSFLFFFGQHFVMMVGGEFFLFYNLNTIKFNGIELINETSYFVLQAIILTTVGFILCYKYRPVCRDVTMVAASEIKALQRVGMLLFAVASLPTLLMLIESLKTLINYGYADQVFESTYAKASGSSIRNIIKIVSFLIIPSFIILLIAYKGTKGEKYVVALVAIYCVLYFATGSRMNACMLLVTYVFMKQRYLKPFTKKEIVKWFFYGLCGVFLFTFISSARSAFGTEKDVLSSINKLFLDVLKSNFILRVVEEMGTIFFTVLTVVENSPSVIEHQFGATYFNSLLGVIPNLFWDVHPASINTDAVFKSFLYVDSGMGSSYITEAYWNFGKACLCIMPFFGSIFAYVERKIGEGINKGNVISICVCFYVFYLLIFFLRSDTISFWRDFVYYGLFPMLLFRLRLNKTTRMEHV